MYTFPADRSPRGTGSGVAALPASRVLQKVPYTREICPQTTKWYIRMGSEGSSRGQTLPAAALSADRLSRRTGSGGRDLADQPARLVAARERSRPVRQLLARRGPVRQLLGSQPSRPARRARSRAATDLAGWSTRSRPRKSRRRLRERLVSAVQSRHLHEGQKCDPEATRRLEKAGPPNPPEVKSDQTSLPNETKVPICRGVQ